MPPRRVTTWRARPRLHRQAFFEDLDTLNIRRAHHFPRATEYIEQMVAIIERLESAGVTYRSTGSIYYRIAAFPAYGELSGARADGLVAGAGGRVDADEYDKEDVARFRPLEGGGRRTRSAGTRGSVAAVPAGTSNARR